MSIVFNLNQIQKLQFSDKAAAEKMLLEFLRKNQDPEITKIELLPKPESLNSVNGFVTYSDQKKLFFKSHTEEGEKLDEYYNAVLLAEAGYPVFSSKKIETQPGQQIVLYEIIDLPTLFDLVKQEEDSASKGSATKLGERLVRAQRALDERTFGIYQATYQDISAAEHARAPVHQLFVHRLESSGRIAKFYSGKSIELNGRVVPFEALAVKRWIVNGVEYKENLNELIERSRCYLVPAAGPSIIGHGDAHNGNVFADIAKEKLFLFDPAFAGRHHPIIDLTKPLFHNVFARWMYYPEQVAQEIEVTCKLIDNMIVVEHSYLPSAIRLEMLESKIELVLRPTIDLLHTRDASSSDWQDLLRASLFCCPFLTVNLLADRVPNGTLAERYTEPVKLLGLAMAVELSANPASGMSHLRKIIDSIFC